MLMPRAGWHWQQCPWQEHLSWQAEVLRRGVEGSWLPSMLLQAGCTGCSAGRGWKLGQGPWGAELSGPCRLGGLPARPAAPLPPARAD